METPPTPPRKEPVRLDAWVAASQPTLGPARRNVLYVVAELTLDGSWVPSSQIKEHFGAQRQPVNRHLRALEAEGLVLLENRGRGLPLYVKATAAGRRAVGMRVPQRPAEPLTEVEEAPATTLPAMIASEPEAAQGRGERFAQTLYAALRPFLRGLEYPDFRRLLLQTLAAALGRIPASAIQAPPPPPPERVEPAPRAERVVYEEEPQDRAPAAPVRPVLQVLSPSQEPPALTAAEEALEERLNVSCHAERREQLWWERTKDFSALWDQVNRWRMGSLGTSFTTFGPRWRHPEWNNFNRARRQADARGARYLDWIQAQFDRLGGPVKPGELHGEDALAAWHKRMASQGGLQGPVHLGAAPYTVDSFNPSNPDHVAYAEELVGQITSLATRVYGQDPDGPIRLMAQAVSGGNLPEAALELRPQWRDRVLAYLGRQAPQPVTVAAPVQQPVPQPMQAVAVAGGAPAPAPAAAAAPAPAPRRVSVVDKPAINPRQALII